MNQIQNRFVNKLLTL